MASIIKARGLSKRYGDNYALDHIDLDIPSGQILGLIGPNGAGKTTALKAILGLIPCEGELEVLGLNPKRQRPQLLEDVCFIADTAILPRWMKVSQALEYVSDVHSKFDIEKAERFIAKTDIQHKRKVGELSKGMVTQLHLALVMAIDAKLLVLDEPTLGLDIIHRKDFYSTLLGEYFDHEKTIVVTTHQVEEVEAILTDLMFIDNGKIILSEAMDMIPDRFVEVNVEQGMLEQARALAPLWEQPRLGGASCIFEVQAGQDYASLGKKKIPSVADLFLAKVKHEQNLSYE